MSRHRITTTFGAVRESVDVDWLMKRAGECDVDPAEPEKCPNCQAYLRAQELEEAANSSLRERLERLRHVNLGFEDRQVAVEAEQLSVDDPELVAWALAVLLHWNDD